MDLANIRFRAILEVLAEHKVEFIIVGGVAGVLHGAIMFTLDLDIVHNRSPDNIERTLAALTELDAFYREQPARKLRPKAPWLESPGHHFLATRLGPLDLLGTIDANLSYADLLPDSEEIAATLFTRVRVLNLSKLIEFKTTAGRDKDKAALPVLKQTLAEKARLSED